MHTCVFTWYVSLQDLQTRLAGFVGVARLFSGTLTVGQPATQQPALTDQATDQCGTATPATTSKIYVFGPR